MRAGPGLKNPARADLYQDMTAVHLFQKQFNVIGIFSPFPKKERRKMHFADGITSKNNLLFSIPLQKMRKNVCKYFPIHLFNVLNILKYNFLFLFCVNKSIQ